MCAAKQFHCGYLIKYKHLATTRKQIVLTSIQLAKSNGVPL